MIERLSTNQCVQRLMDDEYTDWTYNGALALIEYLEDLENDLGEEIELDVVAIRCDYAGYASSEECAREYGYDVDTDCDGDTPEDIEADCREFLSQRTTVIEFEDGIIIQQF